MGVVHLGVACQSLKLTGLRGGFGTWFPAGRSRLFETVNGVRGLDEHGAASDQLDPHGATAATVSRTADTVGACSVACGGGKGTLSFAVRNPLWAAQHAEKGGRSVDTGLDGSAWLRWTLAPRSTSGHCTRVVLPHSEKCECVPGFLQAPEPFCGPRGKNSWCAWPLALSASKLTVGAGWCFPQPVPRGTSAFCAVF